MKFPNMGFGRRIDTWGFGDLLACHPGDKDTEATVALVQTCAGSGGDHAARRAKILGLGIADEADPKKRNELIRVRDQAIFWKQCGGVILLISWAKRGERGKPKRWKANIETL
jgi:hypothetical protein